VLTRHLLCGPFKAGSRTSIISTGRELPWIRTGAAIGLVALLFWLIDPADAWRLLRGADLVLVAVGLVLVQLQVVLSALRWRTTAQRLGQPLGIGRAVSEYYLASLLNLSLPGGISGDAVRAARAAGTAANDVGGKPAAIRAVVLERLAGQVALMAVALPGLAFWPVLLSGALPVSAWWAVGALAALFASLAALTYLLARFGPARIRPWFAGLKPDMRTAWLADGAWLLQGSLSLVIAGLYIAAFAVSSAAIGATLPAAAWLTVIPLTLLTMLLPVSVGGFGLREGAAAALWPLVGLTAADGLAASILYGLISLAGVLPGVVILLRRRQA
jgi:glycosyltransferase 2 family protein